MKYTVELDERRLVASVRGPDLWFQLRLLASLDTVDGPDETLGTPEVVRDGSRIEVRCRSSRWQSRTTVLECFPDRLEVRTAVTGAGSLLTAHLLGGWWAPHGFLPSGSALDTVFTPNPDHPRRSVRPAGEPAVIGVVGDGAEPGVGRWLFVPAPWCYAVSRDSRWAALGIAAPIAEQNFTSMHYTGGVDALGLRLDYEGHTTVDGEFRAPDVVIQFGAADPASALRMHHDLLLDKGLVPPPRTEAVPRHWLEPIFCGWGAQNCLGQPAADFATQENYDRFLGHLEDHGVVPGTIVVDDKWQRDYGTNQPDEHKWPDLRGWIAARRARGQRVLLWWKAWDFEGAPAEACVRLPDGTPVALDPQSAVGRRLIEETIAYLLGPDGLDADGLKIDFLARTPSGVSLTAAGPKWGAALLHELLRRAYTTAKRVKPDSLIITHTPNPAFRDVTDMIRLNDIRMLDAVDPSGPVVEHMRYRAAVVAAACPGTPIDTDGWCLPDRAEWAAYLRVQPKLGVPALYYATHIDHSGEELRPSDLADVTRIWSAYRSTLDSAADRIGT
ncbi:hypothetical protein NLX83_32385 [Allokutzneria sp. A3M-2-11 16]|uniref:hypothetical protein n=1 Tax=Allokutzneria sp. A3M-2-11 16 TaxID=2962043 RepID=UPI0020B84C78|nr:hypothetical protein [Allokutzneria sp. A3M-2-11 16]MCP3803978.1 hypothetical protein [Allokutzneria sp. A3M-2-11 16]